jgi:[ribosomal protein S5]-alanine N-acetyltransferase
LKQLPSDDSIQFLPNMPIIETDRLWLRELVPEDADALAAVISDPETMRFYPEPRDRAGVESWVERNRRRYQEDGHGLWAMVLRSNGEVIGDCGLTRQEVDGIDEIEIGYHVRRDLWGQGYAPEAARACQGYGFGKLNANRLISLIRPQNLPSRRVAEKTGLTLWKEGVWRDLPHCVYVIHRL